jgi:hypothetical protein
MAEDRSLHVDDNVGISDAAQVASRHYLTSQQLWSARHYGRLCAEREQACTGRANFDIPHRGYAISAVLSAVAFLDALVNEVFQDAADSSNDVGARIAPLGKQCIALMAEFWNATEAGSRYVDVLTKFQMALLFADTPRLDAGANPYQDAKLLVLLRNQLVHFRPAWTTHGQETKLEKQLSDKFPPNALLAGTGNPWFPDKCLGAGCAEWAWKSSLALADEWTKRLSLPRAYQSDMDGWPLP